MIDTRQILTKNAAGHGTAIPDVTDGADGTQPMSKEPTVNIVGQTTDKVDIEPITPVRPVKYTEKSLAAYLTKTLGDAPVGMDLYDVWVVSTEEYRTKAEQDAAIHEAVQSQLPDPEPEAKIPALAAWNERRDRQCKVNVLPEAKDGTLALDSLKLGPRPFWSNPRLDFLSARPAQSAFVSDGLIATRLSRSRGVIDDRGALLPAYVRVHLFQLLHDREPVVEMARMELTPEGDPAIASQTVMTAREAAALAHSLLAAVDLMTNAEVNQ